MPKDRLAALEAHFNAEYEQFMKKLDDADRRTPSGVEGSRELSLPNRAEFYDDLVVGV